jgi:hypothetical protein
MLTTTDGLRETSVATVLEQARDAARRGSWAEALDLFGRLDLPELEPGDLEAMADAAWWSCRIDDSIAARQRAYAAYLAAGEELRAAYAAWLLCLDFGIKGESSVGSGWLKRAQRHLAAHPECVERGFLAVTESDIARTRGDLEQARARAQSSRSSLGNGAAPSICTRWESRRSDAC